MCLFFVEMRRVSFFRLFNFSIVSQILVTVFVISFGSIVISSSRVSSLFKRSRPETSSMRQFFMESVFRLSASSFMSRINVRRSILFLELWSDIFSIGFVVLRFSTSEKKASFQLLDIISVGSAEVSFDSIA